MGSYFFVQLLSIKSLLCTFSCWFLGVRAATVPPHPSLFWALRAVDLVWFQALHLITQTSSGVIPEHNQVYSQNQTKQKNLKKEFLGSRGKECCWQWQGLGTWRLVCSPGIHSHLLSGQLFHMRESNWVLSGALKLSGWKQSQGFKQKIKSEFLLGRLSIAILCLSTPLWVSTVQSLKNLKLSWVLTNMPKVSLMPQ